MDDDEFLSYCETHVLSERAGFVTEHVARMFRLAGEEEKAREFDGAPNQIYDYCHGHVRELLTKAKALRALNP